MKFKLVDHVNDTFNVVLVVIHIFNPITELSPALQIDTNRPH
ncbi:hypothetical protein ABIC12_004723 [Pantoea agglomerans]|jgi:hypothetical protein|nr:hypothetical protein [Pantoea agglomerans]